MIDQARMTWALNALQGCCTLKDLLRIVDRVDDGAAPMEFNFHANVVQLADMALAGYKALDPLVMKEQGEMGLIQVALLNLGEQPPTPIIIAMHKDGWRVIQGQLMPRPRPKVHLFDL